MWEAGAFVLTILGMAVSFGALRQKVTANEREIQQVKIDVREDIKLVAADVKEINTFLRNAAFDAAQIQKKLGS
jgi:hypothetical protein